MDGPAWPACSRVRRPWRQTARGGTRDDRMLSEIEVTIPPLIADRGVPLDGVQASQLESAMREITALDHSHGEVLTALGLLLLRNESVASSKIEQIDASLEDYARALHGIKTNPSAVSMVAATTALDAMITEVAQSGRIELETLTRSHTALMADDPYERAYAGRLRDMQNWVGGSDHSPRGALFIPPPPELVAELMADLVAFANRDDLPAMAQAAIAHAQFESIHPFTDGDGRIGRALINAILRRRGATTQVVVPLASALVARREQYFEVLEAYRGGDPRPIISSFARSSQIAAAESVVTARNLATIPEQWRESVGRSRHEGATSRLLAVLPAQPILSGDEACRLVGGAASSVYAAIDRLHGVGVLRPLTAKKRNQIWGAGLVLDELADLGVRIAAAAR